MTGPHLAACIVCRAGFCIDDLDRGVCPACRCTACGAELPAPHAECPCAQEGL